MKTSDPSERQRPQRQRSLRIAPLCAVILLTLIAACAGPATTSRTGLAGHVSPEVQADRVVYVRALFADQERLARVAHKLSVGALPLCEGRTTYTTGAFLFDWDQTDEDWVDAANEALGVNLHLPGIEVLIVLPGSPAARAGLRPGDRILRLGDWRVPRTRGGFDAFKRRLDAALNDRERSIDLRIIRNGAFSTVTVTPVEACAYPVLISEAQERNAQTDGTKIVVFRGMTEFAEKDYELAFVIAHELAHIVRGHVDIQRQEAVKGAAVGAIVDILVAGATGIYTDIGQQIGASIAIRAYSEEHEAEADYLATYLTAVAGYDHRRVPEFLSRVGRAEDVPWQSSSASEDLETRAATVRETSAEIDEQLRRGLQPKPRL